jgi:hypothetical protein
MLEKYEIFGGGDQVFKGGWEIKELSFWGIVDRDRENQRIKIGMRENEEGYD